MRALPGYRPLRQLKETPWAEGSLARGIVGHLVPAAAAALFSLAVAVLAYPELWRPLPRLAPLLAATGVALLFALGVGSLAGVLLGARLQRRLAEMTSLVEHASDPGGLTRRAPGRRWRAGAAVSAPDIRSPSG